MIGRVYAGRYKIIASLGEGGMSRVWRAQDMNTGKAVAVKVLRDEYKEDEIFVRRFEREALAASRMTHPNIANLLDVGVEEDGTRYLVIEYVSGKTLKQFIQESGAIRPETAAQIIIRVLAAVQHAHQNGVIHRDIKPQNILIDKEGTVKVSDFGIARVANSQTMNQDTDTVMGSVYYFSPEQAKGAVVDEKSDIYSVGVVFYEMLTGKVPFTGDTPVAIAMKHLQENPSPPSEINPAVSSAMDFVVLHAMEKRPRNRYASAADMLRDVRLALEHPDTILAARAEMERREREARAAQRRKQLTQKRVMWMRRVLVGVFAALLLGVIVLAGYTVTEQMLRARQNRIEVPNVINMHMDDALPYLRQIGLDPGYREDYYDLVPEGVVADQSLAPGSYAAPGDKITLMVCRSNYDMAAPNLVGIPLSEAQKTLTELGILGENEYIEDNASVGTVVRQDPVAGTPIDKGDTIRLTISGGSVSMPDLLGLTLEQAEQAVVAYRLSIGDWGYVSVDDPELIGKVVEQSPMAYVRVMHNSSVIIRIGEPSSNLHEAQITVDLADVAVGADINISLESSTGEEIMSYAIVNEGTVEQMPVAMYSKTAGAATYRVYVDGELHQIGTVTFLPK